MGDYLDEDQVINSQRYAVLSYVLPTENEKGKTTMSKATPMFKIRGSYSSIDDCESRIKKLQVYDSTFNMFVVEVGKWGALLTEEQIKGNDEIDEVYRNEFMNELVKSRKEEKEKKDKAFEERKEFLKQKAIEEGTAEGQALLASKPEHPISIRDRMEKFEAIVRDLKSQLEEASAVYESTKEKYSNLTPEEIQSAEVEMKSLKIE